MLENLLLKIIVDYLLIEFASFLISSLISPKKKDLATQMEEKLISP